MIYQIVFRMNARKEDIIEWWKWFWYNDNDEMDNKWIKQKISHDSAFTIWLITFSFDWNESAVIKCNWSSTRMRYHLIVSRIVSSISSTMRIRGNMLLKILNMLEWTMDWVIIRSFVLHNLDKLIVRMIIGFIAFTKKTCFFENVGRDKLFF